jgi:hypothetical protein
VGEVVNRLDVGEVGRECKGAELLGCRSGLLDSLRAAQARDVEIGQFVERPEAADGGA